ncbi:hypothetical protein L195_g021592 [Trifolium pratense]|uniref:Uncharacterized protein n=1 Tax=Trifolium pratense TaxID=57577 RepID=A0A2K3N5T3_TRIPR|nr:hypothetical protein L195_g021592 [Trifolium pratense]
MVNRGLKGKLPRLQFNYMEWKSVCLDNNQKRDWTRNLLKRDLVASSFTKFLNVTSEHGIEAEDAEDITEAVLNILRLFSLIGEIKPLHDGNKYCKHVNDKDLFSMDDKMGDAEFDISPFLEAPSGTVDHFWEGEDGYNCMCQPTTTGTKDSDTDESNGLVSV